MEALVVSSKPWIDACWWLGEYKPLPFCLGTAQNSPGTVVSWRHSLFRASHGLMLVGGWGSINLYHSVWELPIMHVVWKIQPSHSCCVDSESMPPKMLFNLYFKTKLWHLYKSMLPSGGPIYLLLCCVITFSNKRQNLRTLLSCSCILCS